MLSVFLAKWKFLVCGVSNVYLCFVLIVFPFTKEPILFLIHSFHNAGTRVSNSKLFAVVCDVPACHNPEYCVANLHYRGNLGSCKLYYSYNNSCSKHAPDRSALAGHFVQFPVTVEWKRTSLCLFTCPQLITFTYPMLYFLADCNCTPHSEAWKHLPNFYFMRLIIGY